MSDLPPMSHQRVIDFGEQSAKAVDRLIHLHPDSPEAIALRAEMMEKAVKLDAVFNSFSADLPWHIRVGMHIFMLFLRVAIPVARVGHRFYHMVKGLM